MLKRREQKKFKNKTKEKKIINYYKHNIKSIRAATALTPFLRL